MKHICDNCSREYTDETLHPVVGRLEARTDPGGIVPSGECSVCGALCYPETNTVTISAARREDLKGLCLQTLEYQRKDFHEVLLEEPLYVELGIITQEEVETLQIGTIKEMDVIINRASEHPEAYHVYGLALRVWQDILNCAD